jgi:hypothetical protein
MNELFMRENKKRCQNTATSWSSLPELKVNSAKELFPLAKNNSSNNSNGTADSVSACIETFGIRGKRRSVDDTQKKSVTTQKSNKVADFSYETLRVVESHVQRQLQQKKKLTHF